MPTYVNTSPYTVEIGHAGGQYVPPGAVFTVDDDPGWTLGNQDGFELVLPGTDNGDGTLTITGNTADDGDGTLALT